MADTQSDFLDACSSNTFSNPSEPSTMPQEHPKKDIKDLSLAELIGHIRRLVEVEESVECDHVDGVQTLSFRAKKNVQALLMHMDASERTMCRRLVPCITESLRHVFSILDDQRIGYAMFNKPSGQYTRVPYNRALMLATLVDWRCCWIRACLGFKRNKQLLQRCHFLDRYIRKHGDALTRALGMTNKEPVCDWAMPLDKSLQAHLLIAVEADTADVYADTILINFFSLHSRIEREAFHQIYGVSVKDARRMEQIPGMSHVLNLRANAHLYPDVFNIEAFRSIIELDTTIAIILAHALLSSNEMPPQLPEIIRKLSFYSIRPSTGPEGPALLLHATGH
ncbi:hypothetical protein SLS58_003946 [Diplodia intermedia]|uniref:Uncharacterized protein n=1 Tax=Diplodia intermedia TaxID=856260 RepID=A0ABR3TV29_9PEZI